jgi:uncharacterized protein YdaU (DUF1376 family)
MHYYQHHIGDFIKDTSFLTNEEVGIYLKLLWIYYDTEKPLPNSLFELSMKVNAREQQDALKGILEMFFQLIDDSWHHTRCDKEIANYQQQIDTASKAGKASAAKRAMNKNTTNDEQTFNERSTDVQPTNNHKPITINQEPYIKEGKPSLSGSSFPPCPHSELLKLWEKHLPHLTQPRTWEGNRQANMRQRWVQAGKPSAYSPEGYKTTETGLKWWDSFFGYIANDTSLANGFETKGRTWRPDLEWIVNATNFQKIIDGKYAK